MIRYMISMAAACVVCLLTIGVSYAQTPVEQVINKYADVKGARNFIASGNKMILARSLIRRTPLAAIASEVDVLEVLKMQNATASEIEDFVKDLRHAFTYYDYYGQQNSPNGTVEIYIIKTGADTIEELVIYNPEIHSVNSLKGSFTTSQLLNLQR